MGVTVRLSMTGSAARIDRWEAVSGETRWVDYSSQQVDGALVVYSHTFRRVRERVDRASEVLLWKPGSTGVARTYAAGEWAEVVSESRSWPPRTLEPVPRRPRPVALRRERRPRR